jgi:hypothetical protein
MLGYVLILIGSFLVSYELLSKKGGNDGANGQDGGNRIGGSGINSSTRVRTKPDRTGGVIALKQPEVIDDAKGTVLSTKFNPTRSSARDNSSDKPEPVSDNGAGEGLEDERQNGANNGNGDSGSDVRGQPTVSSDSISKETP